MNNEAPEVGTYKYHMERAKFWADRAENNKVPAVAKADWAMSAHHLNLAEECIDK